MKHRAILILENIRSAQNVGSLFRTADAVGIEKIYLVGITPTPIDRFGRFRKDIAKTALGAEQTILWEHVPDTLSLIEKLHTDGWTVIAIEQSPKAVDYKKITPKEKTAFILGAEVEGVNNETLQSVDVIAEIPMQGEKESLNVSVAGGVALFRILGR